MEVETDENNKYDEETEIKFSQLIFALGHITIKLLTHVDYLIHHMKSIKTNMDNKNKVIKSY
jgi:hypothetical protein